MHSNTLHTTLQYTAYSSDEARRGELLAEFVRRHGWRFDTLVNSQIATQSFAMGSLVLHGWLPALGGAGLEHAAAPAATTALAALLTARARVQRDGATHGNARSTLCVPAVCWS